MSGLHILQKLGIGFPRNLLGLHGFLSQLFQDCRSALKDIIAVQGDTIGGVDHASGPRSSSSSLKRA